MKEKFEYQYKNCLLKFEAENKIPNDKFSYLRLSLEGAVCTTDKEHLVVRYNVMGEGYNKKEGYLIYVYAPIKKLPDGEIAYEVKKDTLFDVDTRLVLNKEYLLEGNFIFNAILKNNNTGKARNWHSGSYEVAIDNRNMRDFYMIEDCKKNSIDTKTLLTSETEIFYCANNLMKNDTVKCVYEDFNPITYNERIVFNKENRKCEVLIPRQNKKSYPLKIKLLKKGQTETINFGVYTLKYTYFFEPLN